MQAGHNPSDNRTRALDPGATLSEPSDIRRMLRKAAHAMLVVTREGHVVDANARAEALLDRGASDLVGRRLEDLARDEDAPRVAARLDACATPGEAPEELEVSLNHGRERGGLLALTFLPFDGLVALLVRDLTRERRARDAAAHDETAAFRAEAAEHRKMADLGRLVSGVAHELRTPLTFVTNVLAIERAQIHDILRTHPDLEPVLRDILDQHAAIQDGLGRIDRLVRELRPLTKNRPHRSTRMDLSQLAVEAVQTFRGAHGGNARVELDLEATHPISLDREDLLGVVVNLLNNAADAMGGEGSILVQTRNRDGPPIIRVVDRGPGVPPEFREMLFQPFRTTKAEGTGLGLFISRRTVEAHGGTLTDEETPGGGATFVVTLPVSDA